MCPNSTKSGPISAKKTLSGVVENELHQPPSLGRCKRTSPESISAILRQLRSSGARKILARLLDDASWYSSGRPDRAHRGTPHRSRLEVVFHVTVLSSSRHHECADSACAHRRDHEWLCLMQGGSVEHQPLPRLQTAPTRAPQSWGVAPCRMTPWVAQSLLIRGRLDLPHVDNASDA